jgi:hypothetical protein
MTTLISREARDDLGIDTLPRAIIYAVLILKSVTQNNEALSDKVAFLPSVSSDGELVTANFVASVTLNYNPTETVIDGFKLWENILPLTALPSPDFADSTASNPVPTNPLPIEPQTINTVEKYLYWACSILIASVSPNLEYCSLNFSNELPSVTILINLPFNYSKSLLGVNQLESSINFVTAYVTDLNSLNSDWTIPPNAQYWGDPVADVAALKGLAKNLSTTVWVASQSALYTLINALPEGVTADDDLYVIPDDQVETEVWKKGGTGQGTGTGTTQTAAEIRDLLGGLSGTNRLPASAIDGLPSAGDPGLSAYEVAIADGFIGTESEWLTSLEGDDGDPGLSAYEVALANGFVGTESDWLLSLQGDDGNPGSVSSASGLTLSQIATPSDPDTGNVIVYAKSDGNIYKLTAGGTEEAIGSGNSPSGGREFLTSDRVYYISPTGNDSNDGLTVEAPFLTPQKYSDVAATLDRNIRKVTGQFANGTYSFGSSYLIPKAGVGSTAIIFKGNPSDNSLVTFTGTNPDGVVQCVGSFDTFDFQYINFTNTGNGHLINVQKNQLLLHRNCRFGNCGTGWQIVCASKGTVSNTDQLNNSRPMTITGNSSGHILMFGSGYLDFVLAQITLLSNPSFSDSFIACNSFSYANFYGMTKTGSSSGISSRSNQGFIDGGATLP